MTTAHTRNPHDDGLDIATGRDTASGTVVARIFWDDPGDNTGVPGLVLRWNAADDDDAVEFPDDADEAVALIALKGYELDADSIDDILQMGQ